MTTRMPERVPPGDSAVLCSSPSCVPLIFHEGSGKTAHGEMVPHRKYTGKPGPGREYSLTRDAVFAIWRDNATHIISENYSYKTMPYYTILRHELEGKPVQPVSKAVLDAGVVPICLERARLAKIPVCDWGISQGYTPFPAILYGINYFATTSEYRVVNDNEEAKEAVRHITNKGKYPFCYQPLDDGAALETSVTIFGKTAGACAEVSGLARAVYDLFAIPLLTLVMVHDTKGYRLSSLTGVRYSHLSPDERALLNAYLSHQEFL